MTHETSQMRVFAEKTRVCCLEIINARGFGHIGGCMSVCEMLGVLYGGVMRIDSAEPKRPDRDKFVMSKGHAGPALYASLHLRGYFGEELTSTLNREGTRLPSHCDMNLTPGVDMTTGSLGQGVSTALGLAIAQKLDGYDSRTYVCLGDGECNEGQVWEAFMLASHLKQNNFIAFIDYNNKQGDGLLADVLDMGDLHKKLESFGMFTQTVDGHDVHEIHEAVLAAHKSSAPSTIVLKTIKGYGCSFAESMEANHHIAFKPEQMSGALEIARERLKIAESESV